MFQRTQTYTEIKAAVLRGLLDRRMAAAGYDDLIRDELAVVIDAKVPYLRLTRKGLHWLRSRDAPR